MGSHSCHAVAQCVNVPGSYTCRCLPGYSGDGKTACDGTFVLTTKTTTITFLLIIKLRAKGPFTLD